MTSKFILSRTSVYCRGPQGIYQASLTQKLLVLWLLSYLPREQHWVPFNTSTAKALLHPAAILVPEEEGSSAELLLCTVVNVHFQSFFMSNASCFDAYYICREEGRKNLEDTQESLSSEWEYFGMNILLSLINFFGCS